MRLDITLIKKKISASRQKAVEVIRNGTIQVNGKTITKPSFFVNESDQITVIGEVDHYVSRGAHKLLHALKQTGLSLKDKVCLDIGASTGGFTQVCLEAGASLVLAVDVGTNQLHPTLRCNPKVISFEQTHVNNLSLPAIADFICVDVSFIPLTEVIKHLNGRIWPDGYLITLVKPQYEVGRDRLPKNGIVTDPILHRECVDKIINEAQKYHFVLEKELVSPITGKEGNQEFLTVFKYDPPLYKDPRRNSK